MVSDPVEQFSHQPVLLDETLAALNVRPDGVYVDATFGRGGHAQRILDALDAAGVLLVIDRDPTAIRHAETHFGADSRVRIEHGAFSSVAMMAARHEIAGRVDGLLFDFGVSSPQLDDATRGFSFRGDGPLDMRMDTTRGQTAADFIASVPESELARLLKEFGEERYARRIARAIVAARAVAPIETTAALAAVIRAAVPPARDGIDPATRSFQALRIHVNEELAEIDRALVAAVDLLAVGGRLAAISFHSLEDRRVKQFMRRESTVAEPYRGLPDIPAEYRPRLRTIGKLVRAGETELAANPRARSARLRVAERLAA